MLIGGTKVELPPEDVVVFPRGQGNLIFHIRGVDSFEKFDEACPRPKPPKVLKRGAQVDNLDDESFQKQFNDWAQKRQDWLIIQALSIEKNDIEWEQVKLEDSTTWSKVNDELKEAGLTSYELGYLINKVFEVSALSERGMETARANFLQMMSLGLSDD